MLETKSSFMVFYEGKMNTTTLVEIQVMSWNSCVLKHQAANSKQYYKSAGKGINFEPSNKLWSFSERQTQQRHICTQKINPPGNLWAISPFSHLKGGEERKKINKKKKSDGERKKQQGHEAEQQHWRQAGAKWWMWCLWGQGGQSITGATQCSQPGTWGWAGNPSLLLLSSYSTPKTAQKRLQGVKCKFLW